MRKVEPSCIDTCRAYIAALPERRPLSPYDVVLSIVPEINAALSRGQDYAAIAKTLKPEGIALSGATLKKYVQRARRQLAMSGETPPSTPPRTAALLGQQSGTRAIVAPAVHSEPVVRSDQGNGQDGGAQSDGARLDAGHFVLTPDTENI